MVILLHDRFGLNFPKKGVDDKKLCPENSMGKGFAQYLRDNNLDQENNSISGYRETLYKIELLPQFYHYIFTIWIPRTGRNYFMKKTPKFVKFLDNLYPQSSS
jgi:hypothetical protein